MTKESDNINEDKKIDTIEEMLGFHVYKHKDLSLMNENKNKDLYECLSEIVTKESDNKDMEKRINAIEEMPGSHVYTHAVRNDTLSEVVDDGEFLLYGKRYLVMEAPVYPNSSMYTVSIKKETLEGVFSHKYDAFEYANFLTKELEFISDEELDKITNVDWAYYRIKHDIKVKKINSLGTYLDFE